MSLVMYYLKNIFTHKNFKLIAGQSSGTKFYHQVFFNQNVKYNVALYFHFINGHNKISVYPI